MPQIVKQVVLILLIVMPVLLLLFAGILVFAHLYSRWEVRQINRQKSRLLKTFQEWKNKPARRLEIYQTYIQKYKGTPILVALEDFSKSNQSEQIEFIRNIIQQPAFVVYAKRLLARKKIATNLLLINTIGQVRSPLYSKEIRAFLFRYPTYVDVQQLACLALSQLGDTQTLVDFYTNPQIRIVLSFRMLQDIFDHFTGDSHFLVTLLLDQAKDDYIKRACLKTIARQKLRFLAPKIMRYLYSDNPNEPLRIDTIRTLGELQHRPAGPYIAGLISSPRFEIRVVAIYALFQIDPQLYFEFILSAIHDEKWVVRYRAAQVLASYQNSEVIEEKLQAKKDKYALEIFHFMLAQKRLYPSGVMQ